MQRSTDIHYTVPNRDFAKALHNTVKAADTCLYNGTDVVTNDPVQQVFRFDQDERYVCRSDGGANLTTLLADAYGAIAHIDRSLVSLTERFDRTVGELESMRLQHQTMTERMNHIQQRLDATEDNMRTLRNSVLLSVRK